MYLKNVLLLSELIMQKIHSFTNKQNTMKVMPAVFNHFNNISEKYFLITRIPFQLNHSHIH